MTCQDGSIGGQLVNSSGAPIAGQLVQVYSRRELVASATTSRSGVFRIRGVKPGTYIASSADRTASRVIRVWPESSAPPVANNAFLLSQRDVTRGQFDPSGAYAWFEQRPVIGYTVLTTAIVVPVVLLGRRDSS